MKPKEALSSSGNAVVRNAFLIRCFSYLFLTRAPIFNLSMRMLWMQRNMCIAAATFNMIMMSSARVACVLSAVNQKQTRSHLLQTSTLRHIPPLSCPPAPLNHPEILLLTEWHWSHISGIKCEYVWMTVTVKPPALQMWRKDRGNMWKRLLRMFSRHFYPRRLTISAFVRKEEKQQYICQNSRDVHRTKWQALTITLLYTFPVYNKDR